MGRMETERLLVDSTKDGAFLIRPSESLPGAYVLSIMYVFMCCMCARKLVALEMLLQPSLLTKSFMQAFSTNVCANECLIECN